MRISNNDEEILLIWFTNSFTTKNVATGSSVDITTTFPTSYTNTYSWVAVPNSTGFSVATNTRNLTDFTLRLYNLFSKQNSVSRVQGIVLGY